MFIGFLGYSDVPPGGAPSAGDAPDEGEDDARRRREAVASIRARYRVKTSWAGKYAWLISLSVHCAVLIGGFFAVRYYFHLSDVRGPTNQAKASGSNLFVVTSADATDAFHPFWASGIFPGGDSSVPEAPCDEQPTPDFNALGHQTLTSLQDQSPAIGRRVPQPDSGLNPNHFGTRSLPSGAVPTSAGPVGAGLGPLPSAVGRAQ